MPLKTDDLKTVENYKKAIKQEAAKISAAGNTKFWMYRDVELPTASGSKQKLPVLIALVDDTAVKPLLKGKPPACRGVCGIREGKIAFDPSQGTVPYQLLKTSVPLLMGKMLHIPSGVDADAEVAPENGVPAAPPLPSAPPQGKYAQLNASWKQLSQQAAQKMAADPSQRTALTQAMAGIPEMLQGGQLAEAQKRIEQLGATLKIPPPPPPPPPGAPPPGKYAQLNATWKQLSQQAAQKMAANPAQRTSLTQAMAGIPEMLQGGQLAEAQKRIEQLGAALKLPPPPPPPPPAGAPPQGKYPQLEATWKELSQQASHRMALYPRQRAALAQAVAGIPEMLQGGKPGDAQKRLDQLAATLKTLAAEAKAAEAQSASWKKIEESVKQAIDEHPEHKAELVRASAGVAEMIRLGKVQLAERLINNVTELLGRIQKEAEEALPEEERLAQLAESWKTIGADMRRAIARFPHMRDELTAMGAAVEKALQAGKVKEADKLIDDVFGAVHGIDDAQLRFENWYGKMEEIIDRQAKGDSELANKIRLARGVMLDKVTAGDYDAALEMMERVMTLVP